MSPFLPTRFLLLTCLAFAATAAPVDERYCRPIVDPPAVTDLHHAGPLAAGADDESGAAVAVLVQRQRRVRHVQRVHLLAADRDDADLQVRRGLDEGTVDRNGSRARTWFSIQMARKGVLPGELGELRDLRRPEVPLEDAVDVHAVPPGRWPRIHRAQPAAGGSRLLPGGVVPAQHPPPPGHRQTFCSSRKRLASLRSFGRYWLKRPGAWRGT